MTTGNALNGKPYAGNPHVRFDEGEVASAATPRRRRASPRGWTGTAKLDFAFVRAEHVERVDHAAAL